MTGRIGSLALLGMGIAHTVVNTRGFADEGGSWLGFLILVPGLSALLVAIGVIAWRYSSDPASRAARAVIGLGGLLCGALMGNVLLVHPQIIWVPAGPGPWAVIGGPTRLIAALLPAARRTSAPSPVSPATPSESRSR